MTLDIKAAEGTPSKILDLAEQLIQARGYNGFSYANIAAELNLTKAALHYHFAGKAELGESLISRYTTRFMLALNAIDSGDEAPDKLRSYVDLYRDVLQRGRMCLCGMLAAEFETLPSQMKAGVLHFFDENENWLADVIHQGVESGTLVPTKDALSTARMIIGTLEGAVLLARPYQDVRRFDMVANQLLASLDPPP